MHSKNTLPRFIDTDAVSPVVGSILMVALVVIFTTMISGAILAQYNQPENPPDSTVRFEQQAHSNLNQTSNIKITLIEEYNSKEVEIVPVNSSIDLYEKDGTPYIAYKTNDTSACNNAGKVINNPQKPYCILDPSDSSYDPAEATATYSGDQLFICHIPDGEEFQVISKNEYGSIVTTEYTTRYIEGYSDFQFKDRYDNPCGS